MGLLGPVRFYRPYPLACATVPKQNFLIPWRGSTAWRLDADQLAELSDNIGCLVAQCYDHLHCPQRFD